MSISSASSERLCAPRWRDATSLNLGEYKRSLDVSLQHVNDYEVTTCTDLLCTSNHVNNIKKYHDEIIGACSHSAKLSIPGGTCNRRSSVLPGCTNEHSLMRDKSLLWHIIWHENERPKVGLIYNIKMQTRNSYRYAIRH